MEPKVEFDLLKLKNNITNLKKQTKGINFLFPVKCLWQSLKNCTFFM